MGMDALPLWQLDVPSGLWLGLAAREYMGRLERGSACLERPAELYSAASAENWAGGGGGWSRSNGVHVNAGGEGRFEGGAESANRRDRHSSRPQQPWTRKPRL